MKQLKVSVFLIPFVLMLASVVVSIINAEQFIKVLSHINNYILNLFGNTFLITGFVILILVILLYISPIGKIIIGGNEAVPLLKKWQWFSITLCTTIATGLLFWTTAEPLYHISSPPNGLSEARSVENFAISTMYMHWTFNPYAFYTLAAVLFALMYYNYKQGFAVSSILHPITKNYSPRFLKNAIDTVCLYSLLAGMTASLGAGILSISGGLQTISGIRGSIVSWGIISILIVATFIVSAVSGLQRGIKRLSTINIFGFILLAVFVLLASPSLKAFTLGFYGLKDYIIHFIPTNLGIGLDKEWSNDWTVFYWANWLAWTPITALFLGRLGLGYSVRMFIRMNLIYPSIFAILWICIFSGNTIIFNNMDNGAFVQSLQEYGPESAIYSLLQSIPLASWTTIFFIILAFLSYVTAADSNTSAMSALCTKGINPIAPEAPIWLKLVWGIFIGAMAWIMISFAGIDGVRISSVLGGFPVLILMFFVLGVTIKLLAESWKKN